MYTEEFEERGFPFREFLIKLILIVLFIFLLIWVFTKFISPALNKKNAQSKVLAESTQTMDKNLEKMKQAALTYYTKERLPKNNGDTDKITLEQMIKQKIITTLKDETNQPYNQTKSYIQITKETEDYTLKVNLKSKTTEDYKLVHVGNYNYCKTYICEKKKESVTSNKQQPISNVPVDEVETKEKPQIETKEEKVPESTVTTQPKPEEKQEEKVYVYEYQKEIAPVFSNWTLWGNWTKTSCITQAKDCSDEDVTCLEKTKRQDIQEQIGTYQPKEGGPRKPLYGTVCYQSKKTRKLLSAGKTDTKWSTYQDLSLLNNGYHYTGKKKETS